MGAAVDVLWDMNWRGLGRICRIVLLEGSRRKAKKQLSSFGMTFEV